MGYRKRTKFLPTHINALEFIKESIDRAMSQHIARCRKRVIHKLSCWQLDPMYCGNDVTDPIERVFTWMATRRTPPASFEDVPDDIAVLLQECMSHLYTGGFNSQFLERTFLFDLHRNATRYELMSALPREKRERKAKPVLTDVEQRAAATDESIRSWERKFKYAKTRLAKLRRRQKYYAKKGAMADG
jgi:hypothetical protein